MIATYYSDQTVTICIKRLESATPTYEPSATRRELSLLGRFKWLGVQPEIMETWG